MERLINSLGLLYKFRATQNLCFLRLIELSNKIKEIRNNFLSSLPHHINVISIAARGTLKETAHSAILQQILLHPFILDSFLRNIAAIDNPDLTPNHVRPAEVERMDVSIYGKNQCVIIENKVNGAAEQEGQIFRYVEQAMAHKEHHYKPENIHVIYLNPNGHSNPSVYSLTENGLGKNRIPPVVEEKMKVKDYSHDIYEWIKSLQQEESLANQPFLRSALHQYQDYLEEKFELTDKFEPMKQDIKDFINKEIFKGLNDKDDKDLSKRIKILEDLKQDLEQLQGSIVEYYNDLTVLRFTSEIQKEIKELGITLLDMDKDYKYTQSNFGFKINLNGKLGFAAYGLNGTYIAFAFDSSTLTEEEKKFLKNLFEKFGMVCISEPQYPCYNEVIPRTLNKLKEKYLEFAKFIIKKVEEPQEEGMILKIIG